VTYRDVTSRAAWKPANIAKQAGWKQMTYQYIAVAEDALDGSWSAYVPDLPGCTAGGVTADEALDNVQISIELWIEEVKLQGIRIPPSRASTRQIALSA
jgi:predicted RNase H-like HicB family nuclease